MSNVQKILLSAALALSITAVLVSFKAHPTPTPNFPLGSVAQGGEYHASTTRNYAGVAMTNLSVLNTGAGTLGSVVITGPSTGVINLYDSTSTSAGPTSTLAVIPASAPAGTYTFDITYQKGLLIEIVGSAPTSTITYR